MEQTDYTSVSRYWNQAEPSVLGPYMMDGSGFPRGAGRFRFRSEQKIIERLICHLDPKGTVLDLGSGIGHWAEYFAGKFAKVVAVEGSRPFFESLDQRAPTHPNLTAVQANVMEYEPDGPFELIFIGGLLMYLNEADLIQMLRRLKSLLRPGGVILCRESTVLKETETRRGEYQATYRSVSIYETMFRQCGLAPAHREINTPYVLMQMGCESIKSWKAIVPEELRVLSLVGNCVYWGLRTGNPWITRLPAGIGWNFPHLTNHFCLLNPEPAIT